MQWVKGRRRVRCLNAKIAKFYAKNAKSSQLKAGAADDRTPGFMIGLQIRDVTGFYPASVVAGIAELQLGMSPDRCGPYRTEWSRHLQGLQRQFNECDGLGVL